MRKLKMKVPKVDTRLKVGTYKEEITQKLTRKEIHKLVQSKAFELGWSWNAEHIQTVSYTDAGYLFFEIDGDMGWSDDDGDEYFYNQIQTYHTEITWENFLKLTLESAGGKVRISKPVQINTNQTTILDRNGDKIIECCNNEIAVIVMNKLNEIPNV